MSNPLNELLNQAQKIQSQLGDKQKKLEQARFTGEAGAGMVKITIDGLNHALSADIDDSLLSENKTVLQDLIVAAVNDAMKKAQQYNQDNLSHLTDGLNLDKLMDFKFPK